MGNSFQRMGMPEKGCASATLSGVSSNRTETGEGVGREPPDSDGRTEAARDAAQIHRAPLGQLHIPQHDRNPTLSHAPKGSGSRFSRAAGRAGPNAEWSLLDNCTSSPVKLKWIPSACGSNVMIRFGGMSRNGTRM